METCERNHALANLHGSARQLAWLDFATCMVPLAEMHGSTSGVASNGHKSGSRHPVIAPCHCQTAQGATRQLRTPKIPAKGLILLRQSDSSKDLDGAKDAGRNKRIGWLRIIARLVENPRLAILLRLSEIVDHTVTPRVRDFDAQTVPAPAHKL